jgi:3-phenylpropionate/cinnamic acid dioxygenase small subunit
MSTHRCPADDDAAIRNVLGLAALLNDEGDPEDQREVYAPDATWHLGDITRKGADEMVAAAVGRRNDGLLGPGTGTRHLMTLLTVEVADDTAKAVAYFVFVKGTTIVSSGTYHDDLARTGAGWRIARREIILA